jgi:hypothetical protein
VISAAFIHGRSSKGSRSLGISAYVSPVERLAAVAVPEVRHVTELLRLAARELRDAVGREVRAERAVDLGRRDEEARRQLQVAVVLHHAGVEDLRPRPAIELEEALFFERARDLDRSVPPEIEEDHAGAVADGADGRARRSADHEARQVLIREARPRGLSCSRRSVSIAPRSDVKPRPSPRTCSSQPRSTMGQSAS